MPFKKSLSAAGIIFSALTSFSQVDLVITSPTISVSSIAAGSSLSVTCYIYNQGVSMAASSNVGYYLSTDMNWDAGDTYLNYSSGSSLNASASSYRSATLTIPGATAPGSYYILYFADYSNAVAESDETNNVASLSLTVVAAVVDLIIQSQSASPTSMAAGSSVSVSCYIYNQGTSVASSSNVGYYLSADAIWDAGDTYLNYSSGASLNASTSSYRSATVTIPGATPAGAYYILYFADYSNAVTESVETNNVMTVAINVLTPVIDLIIQSPSASPVSVAAGGSVSASCYIYNQGNVAAASSNVGYYLSADAIWDAGDTYLSSSTGTTLNPNTSASRSATLTIPGATTPGAYYILYYADYSNAVAENIETNNVVSVAISVLAPITDLTIQSQSVSPVAVASGSTVSASCYIYNQGNMVVSTSNVGYYLSTDAIWDAADTYLSFSSGGTLNPATSAYKSATLTIPGATAPGSYYILFFADYSNVVAETIETNNVNYVAITVSAPVVDLIIQSQTATPLTIASGSTTSAQCYIYNQGNTSAATSNVGYYLSVDAIWDAADTYLSFSSGSTLTAGTSSLRSATLTIPGATTPGAYYILFYADYSNVVVESVETNNVVSVPVSVVAPTIDLIIQSQTAPGTAIAGNSISVNCYIYNQGNSPASASNVGYYLSTDNIWDAADTYLNYSSGGTLNAATSAYKSASLTIPGGTTPGSYYILFFADYSNVVVESVETNNVASTALTVAVPFIDLIIQSQSLTATSIVAGNSVTASCYIYNQGNSTASASNVGYYLSTDNIWDAADVYLNYSSGTALGATTSSYRSATITIPGATTPGSYYILFFADYSNVVTESVETNNVASVFITVTTPSIDLIIQTPSASPTTVVAGNIVSASCYIYNQGNTTAGSSNVGYYLSTDNIWDAADVYLNNSAGTSLAATTSAYRSASLTIPGATTPGAYYILYFADYSNVVTETVETNNVSSIAITVSAPTIDLIIQTPAASPTTVVAGNSLAATCYIYNQGNSTAGSSNVGYYLSTDNIWDAADVYLTNSSGSSLAGTTSSYRSAAPVIPFATTPGAYYILYFADYSGLVTETVETNNVASVAITVSAPSVDLIIQSPSLTPTTISAGANISASCNIYNQGNSTSPSSTVGYYLSSDAIWDGADQLLNSSAGGALNASSSAPRSSVLQIPASTPAGAYYIIFFADHLAAVGETVETNNYANVALTVTPFTNIIQMPVTGTNTYTVCSGTIYDDGGSAGNYSNSCNGITTLFPASAGNVIRLVFNSFAVETCCDYLQIYDGPNTSSTLIGNYTANPGTITATNAQGALTLRFYSDGSVPNPGFDASISCISAGALADLSPINLLCSPSTIPQASTATVSCQVLNSGTSSAGASTLGYYLSTDTVWDAADQYLNHDNVPTLAASASHNSNVIVTIPLVTPTGSYYLLFVADTGLVISENNETNNVKWIPVTVTLVIGVAPEEAFGFVSVYPNPSSGEVSFSIDVAGAREARVKIYDSMGRLVDEIAALNVSASGTSIQYQAQKKGVFIAEIQAGERKYRRKLIIK